MRTLCIDIETYSDVDLQKSGVYAYTASPNFEILLFAYSFDDEDVRIIDLASKEVISDEIIEALKDETVIKTAFNAQFERTCLSKHLKTYLQPEQWRCTMAQAATLGLPLSLEGAAQVLGLEEQKMKEGRELIRFFTIPCKPTKTNGERTRNLPYHAPEKWDTFKNYCKRDVEVEMAIRRRIEDYPISLKEQKVYILDQKINDRGVLADMKLVENAIKCDMLFKKETITKAQMLTGLDNPNSVMQLKEWLFEKGVEVDSLSKKNVTELAKEADGEVEALLNMRLKLAKTSVKKYEAIKRTACPDGRVRGLFQYYGANRTGRFAGRLVQVQNLPQNHLPDLKLARNLVKNGQFSTLEMLYDNVPNVLSELIRTAFVPKERHRFIVADFSAIEARVIAWLANEKWRMDVFKTHGKIYEASASQMFHVPIEEVTKGSILRQKGKVAELACGYGGGVGALRSMGAIEMGVREEELQGLITNWRNSNPNITKLWWDIDRAALKVVKERTTENVGRIKIHYEKGVMFITLPSGRKLSYIKPRIEPNKFGRDGFTCVGVGTARKWERIETYGPKLTENAVQAIARDLLCEAMLNVSAKGYDIVMHCHDEIIVEAPIGFGSVEELCRLMAINPVWAKGLPLRADGYECMFYRKD